MPPMGGPGGRGRASMEPRKPKNTKAVIKRLFEYVGKYKIKVIIALTFVVLRTLSTLAASYMLRPLLITILFPAAERRCWED